MKYLFALVFCALLSVSFGVYCTSEEECEDTECCVAAITAQALGTGVCTPRGRVVMSAVPAQMTPVDENEVNSYLFLQGSLRILH
ncbi:hypothetical protein JTE90_028160 [Oedothorax gibbosus]|uniref:Uncharacterized protein n=1 Tax=Oedothorax gibbosus TaxID=931172 RepID=A0AAV6VAZ4_9ARAC|nr:hypothetical protein JTE90_028160 [Oedothorax gibbosus]